MSDVNEPFTKAQLTPKPSITGTEKACPCCGKTERFLRHYGVHEFPCAVGRACKHCGSIKEHTPDGACLFNPGTHYEDFTWGDPTGENRLNYSGYAPARWPDILHRVLEIEEYLGPKFSQFGHKWYNGKDPRLM